MIPFTAEEWEDKELPTDHLNSGMNLNVFQNILLNIIIAEGHTPLNFIIWAYHTYLFYKFYLKMPRTFT